MWNPEQLLSIPIPHRPIAAPGGTALLSAFGDGSAGARLLLRALSPFRGSREQHRAGRRLTILTGWLTRSRLMGRKGGPVGLAERVAPSTYQLSQ